MEFHLIRTAAQHRAALRQLSQLMDANPKARSAEGDQLELLALLIEAYEAKHYPIDPPDPIEAIKFRMDQAGLSVKDMGPYIGPPNRVYEVLNGRRPLTLEMIRRLVSGLGMAASVLVSAPAGSAAPARAASRHRKEGVAA